MPAPRPARNLRLTARDTALFEALLERRADTLGTIHRRHWPGVLTDSARRRLSMLVAHGYLHRNGIQALPANLRHPGDADADWVAVYTLTPRAVAALRRRALVGSTLRGRAVTVEVQEAAITHQLAVNRVGDLLAAQLTGEHLLDLPSTDRRHRPDAVYTSVPDGAGRSTVMLEIDLGHYSRQRILGKLGAFLANPDAKGVLFACPTDARSAWIAHALRTAHGDRIMDRVQVLTFEQIAAGRLLHPDLQPAPSPSPSAEDAVRHLPRAA